MRHLSRPQLHTPRLGPLPAVLVPVRHRVPPHVVPDVPGRPWRRPHTAPQAPHQPRPPHEPRMVLLAHVPRERPGHRGEVQHGVLLRSWRQCGPQLLVVEADHDPQCALVLNSRRTAVGAVRPLVLAEVHCDLAVTDRRRECGVAQERVLPERDVGPEVVCRLAVAEVSLEVEDVVERRFVGEVYFRTGHDARVRRPVPVLARGELGNDDAEAQNLHHRDGTMDAWWCRHCLARHWGQRRAAEWNAMAIERL